jgi:hypothetical protein
MPEGSPLANLLKQAGPWKEIYQDKTAELFHYENNAGR